MPTLIVGVLNVTPDSFSDGGRFSSVDEAVLAALAMVEEGADWIDVGGESTRPGSVPVPEAEEIGRVVPVIRELSYRLGGRARLCVDTYKAATARAALAAGASVVNDVSGGRLDPEILAVAAAGQAAVVLGHLRGKPAEMQAQVHFDDVVAEVADELAERVAAARAAGCAEIWADPGIGFGKHLPHNLALLKHLAAVQARVVLSATATRSITLGRQRLAILESRAHSPNRRVFMQAKFRRQHPIGPFFACRSILDEMKRFLLRVRGAGA